MGESWALPYRLSGRARPAKGGTVPRDTELSGGATSVTPPYAAYVSFDAFIRRAAAEGVPVVVDKSLLIGWAIAAGNESGVLTSLKSLGLIDDAGRPTE